MRLQVLLAWTLCCSLGARVIASAKVIRPSLQTPRTTASVVFRPHHHRQHHQQEQAGRRSGRSNSGASSLAADGVGNIGMRLDGSSSSPVEPIKPLLDLSSVGEGASQAVPPYPMFDEAAPRNVSGLTGNAAYLHCIVHNLGNKSVSWIRQRDLHILTVKRYTYTTDQRFEVIHSEGSKDWILKIKYAQVRDSGNYECQVSTKPVKSYVIHLNIFAAPKAMIIGAPDMHVDKGSTINLTCIIAHSPEPPGHIFWYHNGKVLNYDSPRGGITEVTERGISTTGYLLIQATTPASPQRPPVPPCAFTSSTARPRRHADQRRKALAPFGRRSPPASGASSIPRPAAPCAGGRPLLQTLGDLNTRSRPSSSHDAVLQLTKQVRLKRHPAFLSHARILLLHAIRCSTHINGTTEGRAGHRSNISENCTRELSGRS
ncbi:Limbic system-associated membrane protein [Penaeus vannamei]|uniref:Limbic system-associated membrane protein n=1 Tax=Penaeus vannamei TaxID=6689 RepID=A0A3R7Q7H4_PENVA|nr:Limbic system-associated membrane protein [Penaeus vannamei]